MMRVLVFIMLALSLPVFAAAHEVRPAYLELVEMTPGEFQVSWKQPVADGRRLALEPRLPEDCIAGDEPVAHIVEGAIVSRWTVTCTLKAGVISIAGLDRTLTDVFIEVRYLDEEVRRAVIRPGEAGLELTSASGEAAPAYLRLGVEHILSGPDHLLFVAGLLLLSRLRKLIAIITAFTLAHSLTLGLTSLGLVTLAPGPVELLIAVSILLLAVEAVRVMDGKASLAAQMPWLVSFGFGLLHGFGFAGALSDIGLPAGAEIAALLFFNIGVEIGQLLFIGVLLIVGFALTHFVRARFGTLRRVTAYGVGISGAFWVFERAASLFAA